MKTALRDYIETGAGQGFDLLRLIAAAGVLVSHSYPLTGRHEPLASLLSGRWDIGAICVAIFFSTSGFLIAMSADRTTSPIRFAEKRALRIMPALLVVVLLTVFVLGPIVTSLDLRTYFQAPLTYRYLGLAFFLPATGHLPGVFTDNIYPDTVNGSLWTLRLEVACYIIVFFLRYLARLPSPLYVLMFVVFGAIEVERGPSLMSPFHLFSIFFAGSSIYALRSRIQLRIRYFALALAAVACSFAITSAALVAALPLAYIAIYVGYRGPSLSILHHHDLSYGLYLYAFPVQQLIAMVFVTAPWLNCLIALPITLVLSMASWIGVEKRAKGIKIISGIRTARQRHEHGTA